MLVTGGDAGRRAGLAEGCFYPPTSSTDCDREMRVVREETFGPILTVERFGTEAEAVELGNDTAYGLAGGVRTPTPDRAERVAPRCGTARCGSTTSARTPPRPSGAVQRSGNGRELGPTGLAEYQETQAHLAATPPGAAGVVQRRARGARRTRTGAPPQEGQHMTASAPSPAGIRTTTVSPISATNRPRPQHRQVRQLRRRRQLHLHPHRHLPAVLLRLRHRRSGVPGGRGRSSSSVSWRSRCASWSWRRSIRLPARSTTGRSFWAADRRLARPVDDADRIHRHDCRGGAGATGSPCRGSGAVSG